MRTISVISLSICVFSQFILSGQEVAGAKSDEASTRIPNSLEVPDFIPPAPIVPKSVPAMLVDSAITVPSKASCTLTVIRGEASTLPDLPAPPEAVPSIPRTLTPEELERIKFERRHSLVLGATTFDHCTSDIQWNHPDTGKSYRAVCGFDVGLLEGIGGFIHNGESYSLMLMHSNIDTSAIRRIVKDYLPDIPEVSADSILILKGDPDDPIGTAPINVLKEIIAAEKTRLVPYQADRRNYQQAAAEWEKAHPRLPRDETFWFKPHRGSRYLKPATQGGTR